MKFASAWLRAALRAGVDDDTFDAQASASSLEVCGDGAQENDLDLERKSTDFGGIPS